MSTENKDLSRATYSLQNLAQRIESRRASVNFGFPGNWRRFFDQQRRQPG
jgi:hypothetical protein